MQCPFCKSDIDNDSFYCDQCGKEILICPKCNKPGKGKMCIMDGTPLVSMKEKIGAIHTDSKASVVDSFASKQDLNKNKSLEKSELHLINKNLGLDIKIEKDVLIGRETGDFVDIFGKHPMVSGQHLRVNFDLTKGWLVTDLGSTHGTKYNNMLIVPNQPQIISDNSYLTIANIEFYVQILTSIKLKNRTTKH